MPTLKDLRLQKFLTQAQLAERIGVKYQLVQRWETGRATPRPASMEKLAEALGVSGGDLLEAIKASVTAGTELVPFNERRSTNEAMP